MSIIFMLFVEISKLKNIYYRKMVKYLELSRFFHIFAKGDHQTPFQGNEQP